MIDAEGGWLWPRKRLVGVFTAALTSLATSAAPPPQAELSVDPLPSIDSVPTNLSSNAEVMVSYRHQERMWQTADGALHLVINRGNLKPTRGIVLNSSYDGGTTWLQTQVFANTNRNSTVDGLMQGSHLWLSYADANGAVVVAQLAYDSSARAWSLLRSQTAFASAQFEAHNPTLGIDDLGVVWCSFASIDRRTADINLRLLYRANESAAWGETSLVFGPTDNLSKERSARLVRIPGGMGLIYRVRQSTHWATRVNGASFESSWQSAHISEGSPQRPMSDPYASHFSVIGEGDDYLHLAIADGGAAMYLRYTVSSASWTTARKVNGNTKLSYLQAGMSNGQVAIALSAARGAGAVLVSADHGATFSTQFQLALPPLAAGVSYKTGRVEMPGVSVGTLAVLQQYEDHKEQRLMVFKVPEN